MTPFYMHCNKPKMVETKVKMENSRTGEKTSKIIISNLYT